ncbi:sugar ABC transporter permease [Pseudanabaena yagii]|uniref:Sugar ABC transporter permease n=1 Tax=Pseudanabaena yagii GIHE-NHR1 TaxID=2722753 RepID=A0ABX1LNQ3_9CYAN|nr:sugar ABC transporter permease [Pseudanabaena yagii]NMF57111.1 sugar ABC transporter permease [Pseudanabaena yagii GIHE-NHR1]
MAVNVCVNLEVVDLSLDAEDLQGATRNLLKQVRAVDGVEEADLVAVTDVPEGAMALGGFVVGLLTAEVSAANLQKLGGFLKDRIVGKTLKMSVEACGKKIAIEGSSQVEFEYVLQKANEQIARWASESQSGN